MNFIRKNWRGLAFATALALAPVALQAQQTSMVSIVREAISRQGRNLTAGAQRMPAARYNYAPTPEQATFGHLVLRIVQSNGFSCSRVSGVPAPSIGNLTGYSPKDRLIQAMKSSFRFCDEVLAKMHDSDLASDVRMSAGRSMSKAAALVALANDLADRYAQEAIYLRLNGRVLPAASSGTPGPSTAGKKVE